MGRARTGIKGTRGPVPWTWRARAEREGKPRAEKPEKPEGRRLSRWKAASASAAGGGREAPAKGHLLWRSEGLASFGSMGRAGVTLKYRFDVRNRLGSSAQRHRGAEDGRSHLGLAGFKFLTHLVGAWRGLDARRADCSPVGRALLCSAPTRGQLLISSLQKPWREVP